MTTKKPEGSSPREIFDFLGKLNFFSSCGETGGPPISLQVGPFIEGAPPLAVVVGENANGKSFLRRITKEVYKRLDVEVIDISMQARRQVSYNIGLAFVYGDEDHDSTGFNAAYTITGAIKTSRARTTPHAVFWDEPDVGLSEGWAACAGRTIAEFARTPPDKLQGAFVVTHSRPLLRELRDLNPLFVYVGDDAKFGSLDEWLASPAPRYENLSQLNEAGRARYEAIQKVIDANNRARAEDKKAGR